MQHLRKITTLSEDMAALGLAAPAKENPKASRPAITESKARPKIKASIKESKKAASAVAKRKKAQESRARRLESKASAFKTAIKKLQKENKSRPQLRLTLGVDKTLKSLTSLRFTESTIRTAKRSEFTKAFESVSVVAGLLARKFAVLEDLMDIPVIHPDSAYGYDVDHSNMRDGNKDGDATDYAQGEVEEDGDEEIKDLAPPPAVDPAQDAWQEDEDAPEDKPEGMPEDEVEECEMQDEEDEEIKEDDGDADEDDKEDPIGEEDEEGSKADDVEDEKEKKVAESAARRARARYESMPMNFDLNAIRMEAENLATQVSAGASIGPSMVAGILNDMVSYLGGAMKMYQTLAGTMQSMYVGKDQPAPNEEEPAEGEEGPEAYIGLDGPEGSAVGQGDVGKGAVGQTDGATPAAVSERRKVAAKAKVEARPAVKPAVKTAGKVLPGGLRRKV
jgi:hypothetical protein